MSVIQKKICLLGEFAVGKTSLVRRFVYDAFDDKYLSTIGVKVSRKIMTRGERTLHMLVWDLAGGSDFEAIQRSYLRGASGAVLVCDLTRRNTLDALLRHADQVRGVREGAPMVVLGNKADLTADRAISDEEIAAVADQIGAPHLLTSAKDGLNVEAAFQRLAEQFEVPSS